MPTATVNGVRLHYEVYGSGRDMVLCHGFSGSLIIVGDEDTPFLRPAQVMKEGIPNARVATIPGSGHYPHIEQPQAFRRVVRKFLSQHYPHA